LVLGGGTIGLLTAVVVRAFGATLVAVSDIVPERRAKALELVADEALDPTMSTTTKQAREMSSGGFEFVFEASGSPLALRHGFPLVRAGGTIVQIGTLGSEDVPIPANLLMNREINYVGSMRYSDVFS
jgi:L-idonate 5-dehydrogenase